MSQYKITFIKNYHVLFGTSWSCTILDRSIDREYRGTGNTKQQAKENAWDELWSERRQSNDDSDYDDCISDSEESKSYSPTHYQTNDGIKISFAGMLISSIVVYGGHYLFEDSKDLGFFNIKGGLGPAIGILIMIVGGLGFLFFIIMFLSEIIRRPIFFFFLILLCILAFLWQR